MNLPRILDSLPLFKDNLPYVCETDPCCDDPTGEVGNCLCFPAKEIPSSVTLRFTTERLTSHADILSGDAISYPVPAVDGSFSVVLPFNESQSTQDGNGEFSVCAYQSDAIPVEIPSYDVSDETANQGLVNRCFNVAGAMSNVFDGKFQVRLEFSRSGASNFLVVVRVSRVVHVTEPDDEMWLTSGQSSSFFLGTECALSNVCDQTVENDTLLFVGNLAFSSITVGCDIFDGVSPGTALVGLVASYAVPGNVNNYWIGRTSGSICVPRATGETGCGNCNPLSWHYGVEPERWHYYRFLEAEIIGVG